MLAHPMWSVLRHLIDGADTRAEWHNRTELHRIRQAQRRGLMQKIEKAERAVDVMEQLGTLADDMSVAAEEAREGKTTTLRKMFGDTQVDALKWKYE